MIGDSFQVPNYAPPLQALATLIKCTSTNGIHQLNQYAPKSIYQDSQEQIDLGEFQLKILLDQYNFRRVICTYGSQSNQATNAVRDIVTYICWGDITISHKAINYFLSYLMDHKRNPQKLGLIFKLMIEVLSISDGLQIDRLDTFFNQSKHGIDFDVIARLRQIRYPQNGFTIICLVFIMNIYEISMKTKEYMKNLGVFQKMKWIVDFLEGTDRQLQAWNSVEKDLIGFNTKKSAKLMAEEVLSSYKDIIGQERYEQIRQTGQRNYEMPLEAQAKIYRNNNLPRQIPQIETTAYEKSDAIQQFIKDYPTAGTSTLKMLGIDQPNDDFVYSDDNNDQTDHNSSLEVNTGAQLDVENFAGEIKLDFNNNQQRYHHLHREDEEDEDEALRLLMEDSHDYTINPSSQEFESQKEEFQRRNNDIDDLAQG